MAAIELFRPFSVADDDVLVVVLQGLMLFVGCRG